MGKRKFDPDKDAEPDDAEVILELPAKPAGRPNANEQYDRNMKIVQARLRRKSWSRIAAEFGLTPRRCQMIFKEWGEQNKTLRHAKPLEIVDDMLHGLQTVLEELNEVASSTSHDAVKVGALNSIRQTWREIAELLQATGVLPNDLGTMHHTHDIEVFSERIIEAIDQGGLSLEQKMVILTALGGPTTALDLPAGHPSQN